MSLGPTFNAERKKCKGRGGRKGRWERKLMSDHFICQQMGNNGLSNFIYVCCNAIVLFVVFDSETIIQ